MLQELREKHPRFIYESFQTDRQDNKLRVRFRFILEPNIVFCPEVILPLHQSLNYKDLGNFAFHLGLIEMVSYWKAACPKEVRVEAGQLTKEQINWWHDLFIHGLGDFFYHNNIDFTPINFLQIKSNSNRELYAPIQKSINNSGDLILVGGGKDSTVTMELLKGMPGRKRCLILNPTRAALESVQIVGYPEPLVVERTIDQNLLKLNQLGYLNGHTPFSAYLAFLGAFVGTLHECKNIIVSNDHSTDEGNVLFHDLEINHQYSKSFRFEKLFREYSARYLTSQVQYFSFLRPLYEIQVSQLFVSYPEHHFSFRSCNVGQKEDRWCGECAKCVFVYISLFPFLSPERMKEIFGKDYYLKPKIEPVIRALVGLKEPKPFECIGTKEESILAVALAIRRYKDLGGKIPSMLVSLGKELGLDDTKTVQLLEDKIKKRWNSEHFLPEEYVKLLKAALVKLKI